MFVAFNQWVLQPILELAAFTLKEQPCSLDVRH